ncbi:MAG: glycosyltransferase [bacterium]
MIILQVIRDLGLGGAQTYLLKLSQGLIARGHRVIVASGGGEMTDDFINAGIPVLHVPTAGLKYLSAQKQLVEIIRREKVDVINAHHWSAGAACYLAARQTDVRYLLTVHGPRDAWQRFLVFYWSPQVLALSPSTRENLVKQLHRPRTQVIESFVGVDIESFSPGEPSGKIDREFGITSSTPVILHISRFSATKGQVTLALIDSMRILARTYPGLTTLIGGWGSLEEEINVRTLQMNKELGYPAIHLMGRRNDVVELLRRADVVVGTASFACEAMATARPVVAAGAKGYMGIVKADDHTESWRQNWFGDHSARGPVTGELLAYDLQMLLEDKGLCEMLGNNGRTQMVNSFSLAQMILDMERIYESLPPMKKRQGQYRG